VVDGGDETGEITDDSATKGNDKGTSVESASDHTVRQIFCGG
jgi:hypothetical protein